MEVETSISTTWGDITAKRERDVNDRCADRSSGGQRIEGVACHPPTCAMDVCTLLTHESCPAPTFALAQLALSLDRARVCQEPMHPAVGVRAVRLLRRQISVVSEADPGRHGSFQTVPAAARTLGAQRGKIAQLMNRIQWRHVCGRILPREGTGLTHDMLQRLIPLGHRLAHPRGYQLASVNHHKR